MHTYARYIIGLLIIASCQQSGNRQDDPASSAPEKSTPETTAPLATNLLQQYDFTQPNEVIKLPKELREISGIRLINDSILVMISDSKPDVFFFNIRQKSIINQIRVASRGDFEDIEAIGNNLYVLQSNGILWTIRNYNTKPELESDSLSLELPFELEGLSSNEKKDSLYIAAKYWHKDPLVPDDQLPVWAWSTSSKKRSAKPVLFVPDFVTINKKRQEFHTSAIWPSNKSIWLVLSTNDKYMLQMQAPSQLDTLVKLDDDIFVKPEGMAMDQQENLYISNEGKYDKATLLIFNKLR